MRLGRTLVIAFAAGTFLAVTGARAQEDRAGLSPDWWACVEAAELVQSAIDAPDHLLTAIALNETGRRAPNSEVAPWPWTINVGGQGIVFANKEQAVIAAQQLLNSGTRSFDVGCMQVNVFFHPRAFTSFEEAFDPLANMMYAADYLERLQADTGSWTRAVELYHSYTEEYNQVYGARFRNNWDLTQRRAERGDVLVSSRPMGRVTLAGSEVELLGAEDGEARAFLLGERDARFGEDQTLRNADTTRTPIVAELLASHGDEMAISPLTINIGLDLRTEAIDRHLADAPASESGS